MSEGLIQQLDHPETVYSTPANRFVAGFIGSPSMNFIAGELDLEDGRSFFRTGDVKIDLTGYTFRDKPQTNNKVELGIRPEHVKIGREATAQPFHCEAVIDITEPMGADTLLWTSVAGQPLAARVSSETDTPRAGRMILGFSPERVSLFDAISGKRL
jgi:multiple sugar transport system ATP-binding protein